MRYKASITNWCLCEALSIIVPHVFFFNMNLPLRTETQFSKQDAKKGYDHVI